MAMQTPATRLPVRLAELVSWAAAGTNQYLIRNRRTGESFQLGEQEHFLLEQLDGRQTGQELCASYTERFGQPLSLEELDEFVQVAAARGLLQEADPSTSADGNRSLPGALERAPGAPAPASWSSLVGKRIADHALTATATGLMLPAVVLGAAAHRIRSFRLRHLQYVSRPDDVFIVTYPRSGTTWTQMILYQLTTDGNVDFPHICEFCPWFEKSRRSANGFEERPSPRLFKSHLSYRKIPKGSGKYIYVARNGRDVAVSYYHLYRMYGHEITFEKFFRQWLRGRVQYGSWFEHVKGWWKHRDDPNVLFLTYEQLSHDLEGGIKRIAEFCGWDIPPERLPGVLQRCSFTFMKQHEDQFNPVLETLWEQRVELKSFLRQGWVGDGATSLTEGQKASFDDAFRRRLGRLNLPFETVDVPT